METQESVVLDLYIFNETQTLVLISVEGFYNVYLLDANEGELGKETFSFEHNARRAYNIRKNSICPELGSENIKDILSHPYDKDQYYTYVKIKKGT